MSDNIDLADVLDLLLDIATREGGDKDRPSDEAVAEMQQVLERVRALQGQKSPNYKSLITWQGKAQPPAGWHTSAENKVSRQLDVPYLADSGRCRVLRQYGNTVRSVPSPTASCGDSQQVEGGKRKVEESPLRNREPLVGPRPPIAPRAKKKGERPTVESMQSSLEEEQKKGLTEQSLIKLLDMLVTMTVKDIQKLRQSLGTRRSERKMELIDSIKEKLQESLSQEGFREEKPIARLSYPNWTGRDTLGRRWEDGKLVEGDIEYVQDDVPVPDWDKPPLEGKELLGVDERITEEDEWEMNQWKRGDGLVPKSQISPNRLNFMLEQGYLEQSGRDPDAVVTTVKCNQLLERLERARTLGSIRPPRTVAEVRKLASIYANIYPSSRRRLAAYLGIEGEATTGQFGDQLRSMFYRHLNPVSVANRLRDSKKVQDLVNQISLLPNELDNIKEIDAEIEALYTENEKLDDRLTELGEQYEVASIQEPEKLPELQRMDNEIFDRKAANRKRIQELRDESFYNAIKRSREKATALLKADRPVPINVNESTYSPEHTAKAKEEMSQAVQWLSTIVQRNKDEDNLEDVGIKIDRDASGVAIARANYNYGTHEINLSPDGVGVPTSVHELGHAIENKIVGALGAARDFVAYRCKGEPLTKLAEKFPRNGFGDNEYGRKDKFGAVWGDNSCKAYYAGKTYMDKATEIISMGVEQLYKDPVSFCRDDPEYAAFIIGVLNGEIRNKEEPLV